MTKTKMTLIFLERKKEYDELFEAQKEKTTMNIYITLKQKKRIPVKITTWSRSSNRGHKFI